MALYTKITDIVAPSSAQAGNRVSVTIKIQNTWTGTVHVSAIGVLDSEKRFIDWLDYWIPAGVTHSFAGAFIMPNEDVTINAYSYYEAEDGWRFDDSKSKSVRLEAAPVPYWHEIGTAIRRVVSVKIIPPEVPPEEEVPPEVEVPYWHEIGTAIRRVVSVKIIPPEEVPPEVEVPYWHEIGTAIRRVVSVKIIPPEVPPEEEVPPEVEKEIPWGPIALVGGGLALVAALAAKPKSTERKK